MHRSDEVRRNTGRRTCAAMVVMLGLLLASVAVHAEPSDEQFRRSSWYLHDDAPADIWALIQARDGYLLLGTGSGLYRFDGVRFERFALPSGNPLPPANITAMTQLPDGDIWLGFYSGGAARIHDRQMIRYASSQGFPDALVFNFSLTDDGVLWAATSGGLVRFAHGRWELVGDSWNYPAGPAEWSLTDRAGNLWVTTGARLLLLRKGARQFLDTPIEVGGSAVLAQAPDGMLWLSDGLHGTRALPGVTAEHPQLARQHALPATTFAQAKRLLFDRAGHLWITDASHGGLLEVAHPDAHQDGYPLQPGDVSLVVKKENGLTADFAVPLAQDREGTVWVGTNLGLNSFRPNNVFAVPGLNVGPLSHIAMGAGVDGSVWIINSGTLFRARHGQLSAVSEGIPDAESLQVDRGGALWFGRSRSLYRRADESVAALPAIPAVVPTGMRAMATDQAGGLWVSVRGHGIQHFGDGRWTPLQVAPALAGSDATCLTVDHGGRLWIGYSGSRLALRDATGMHVFTETAGLDVGSVKTILATADGALIGGDSGLARMEGGILRSISSRRAAVLSGISGIARLANGDVWINGNQGVVRIRREDLDAAFLDAVAPLRYSLFDYDAGLPGIAIQESPSTTALADSDGTLWFLTNQGVAWIDPGSLRVNPIPPPVDIQSLTAMGRNWPLEPPIHLPEHTSNLQIAYTALSLAMPRHVRFRYRLSGVDERWQEAGARRQAFYTNLKPGSYHFQVIAANADGVWNRQGATIDFSVLPTFYQTTWFRLLCVLGAAGALFFLYLLRLQKMTLRVHERLHERHLERERIARALHDTLLQSVQGLVLRFQVAAEKLAEGNPARVSLEKALERADDVLVEARNRVSDLRAVGTDCSSLSRALAAAGEELAQGQSISIRVSTLGARRRLNPMAREGAYRVGREALTNAFIHANATSIEVEINYDPDFLKVRIRDDGVGMDDELLGARSKPGHWGLAGMHERAEHMDATLRIWSGEGKGTEVALDIPSIVAYSDVGPRYVHWLRRLVSGGRDG